MYNYKENDGKHLENTLNLYQTEEPDSIVGADVRSVKNELSECARDFKVASQAKDPNAMPAEDVSILDRFLEEGKAQSNFTISRNLKTKKYTFSSLPFSSLSPEIQDKFARELIKFLPYILYNDDFTDRPVTSVEIPP